ncbi:DsbA family protein [Stakelama saccharophila]|uniref:Thioredoxin domain-containing protein n=1 Tax=Stakelama saccharophila TaxID=3075605 RepID=A0ABZ0B989_9SPHN|nr:thioredoxin domain-containing protein [Stakelama sp. W311]WNO53938.1 thioredoxin domain-containing protein [Stakelama sp. W311]
MRLLLVMMAALAGLLTTGPAQAGPKADWAATVATAADGAAVVGNPDAPVRLVEYLSYTCPHCADYVAESAEGLEPMIADGTVAVTLRNAVRDPLDIAAAMLTRCAPRADFVGLHRAIFADQKALQDGARTVPGMYSRVPKVTLAEVRAVAEGSGLTRLARESGMTADAVDACLTDEAAFERLRKEATGYWSVIRGTPSFAINGTLTDAHGWAELKPELTAAAAAN